MELLRAVAGPWGAQEAGKVVADGGAGRVGEPAEPGGLVTCRRLPPLPWVAAGEKHCPIPHERNISVNRIRTHTLGWVPHPFLIYFFLKTQPKGRRRGRS